MADEKKKAVKSITRKPVRYPVDTPTTFRIRGEEDWHRGVLVNLSSGGFCLQTSTALRAEQMVEFLFDTVDRTRKKHRRLVLARVVWKRLTRYGVQFVRSTGRKGIF